MKKYFTIGRKITYKNGWIVEEQISSFSTVDSSLIFTPISEPIKPLLIEDNTVYLKVTEEYKKKNYLQVDMIDFWINSKNN